MRKLKTIKKASIILALKISFAVGIILNIINNPESLTLNFTKLNSYKVILTFIVPFCVSLYSSVLANQKKCPENIKSK
jgi:hypothetical protein